MITRKLSAHKFLRINILAFLYHNYYSVNEKNINAIYSAKDLEAGYI
jgi:hypothetical protein